MRGYTPTLLAILTALASRKFVSGRAVLQSGDVALSCNEHNCLDLPHAPLHLSKRVDFTIPHDDPFGAPHGSPGSGPHGSGPHGSGPHDPSIPAGNPLSTSDDPTKVLSFSDYHIRGLDASSRLDQVIANRLTDKISNSHTGYSEIISTERQTRISDILRDSDVNLDPADTYRRMKLISNNGRKDGENDDHTRPTYDAGYNTDRGAIVVHDMDKREDTWPKDNPNKIQISDLMVQVYRQFGGNLKGLRVIIQDPITNSGTLETLKKVYQDMGEMKDYTVGIFSRPVRGETDINAQAFNALLGTDNVRPTVYMLTDHHTELGDKLVQKIITFPPELGDGFGWNIAIILG